MKQMSIHKKRVYLMRINDRRVENRMRKVKHRYGIHLFRQHGPRTMDALKMHHWDRVICRRVGYYVRGLA